MRVSQIDGVLDIYNCKLVGENNSVIACTQESTVNIYDGEIISECDDPPAISNKGLTVTITGGKIKAKHSAITNDTTSTVIINGGVVESLSTDSACISNKGRLDINNGEVISNGFQCIRNYEGATTNVNSGTVKTVGANTENVIANYGETNICGGTLIGGATSKAALHNYTSGTMNISGGSMSADGISAMTIYNTGHLNITGGNISGVYYAIGNELGGQVTVSNATINTRMFFH